MKVMMVRDADDPLIEAARKISERRQSPDEITERIENLTTLPALRKEVVRLSLMVAALMSKARL